MESVASVCVYLLALPLWFVVWWTAEGFALMRTNRLLALPFGLCPLYLLINAALVSVYGGIGSVDYEESRFVFIGERAMIAVQATASVLIVATIVYGLSIRRVPLHFIRFMVYAFVAILGLMAPIVWVPIELPGMFYILRHAQTVALHFGLFLCVAGIVVLLRDLLAHGQARLEAFSVDPTPADDGDAPSGLAAGASSDGR